MNYFNNFSYTISHIFLMLFLYLFISHRYSKTVTRCICFFSALLLSLTDCLKLNLFPDSTTCYIITTLFQIFITQFTGIFIAKKRNSKVLFIGLSASNYTIVGSVGASILRIYTGNEWLALAGNLLIHALILILLYLSIHNLWIQQYDMEDAKGWWELCLIPVFFYCSFSCIAFFPYTLYENPENTLGILCFIVTMFVSYTVVLRYIESDAKRKDIYWKNVLFESYIKGLENQYYLVEQSEQNLKILRHDMRHYSAMICHLLNTGEYEEIQKIASHIQEVAEQNKVVSYCSNLMVNTIISKMMETANALSITVHLNLFVPKQLPVNVYEFTSVIANLFENAIHCVKDFPPDQRSIEVKIHCESDHLLFHMKNEYQEEILFHPVTGLPKSQKGGDHGLGMQSVLAFSNKINGSIDCFCEDGIFEIILFAKF
ncbi:MAG: sensor histidine kinase [Lachnospiraceae bacterium]|nr:sensor histidine kinase [Lachnospiraceae bacterium]